MPSTVVIELLGVATAGKSGLAQALASTPGTVIVKDHDRRDLPALLRGAARAWPVLLAGPPAGESRMRWAAWAGRLAAAPSVAGHRSPAQGGMVVLDQGPAYTLGRMLEARRLPRGNHWWHRQVCATAGLLDLLVVLDASPEILAGRLRTRGKAHRAAWLDDLGTARYLAAEQERCRIVSDAVGRAGARVLYLDTGRLTVQEQVSAVQGVLRPAPRTGRPA